MKNGVLIGVAIAIAASGSSSTPSTIARQIPRQTPVPPIESPSPIEQDLGQWLGAGATLGLLPTGSPKDLRGVHWLYLDVERFDNDAFAPHAIMAPDTRSWSPRTSERQQLAARLTSQLPGLEVVEHLGTAEAVILICEVHLDGRASGREPTTSCRIYRVLTSGQPPLRMLMRLGPYRGELAGNLGVVSDAIITAYHDANPLSAHRTLPN